MRLLIEKTETIENGYGTQNITIKHEFDNVNRNTSWIDWGSSYIPKGCSNIRGAYPHLKNFAFKIVENKNNRLCLEVQGEVVKKMTAKDNYPIQKIILDLNNTKTFKTKQNGLEYSITLLEDEEQTEKMPLRDFYMLFLDKGRLSPFENNLYIPIIYNLDYKYYKAIIKWLEDRIITHLEYDEFKIGDILSGYWNKSWYCNSDCDKIYLEALIILNNLEKSGDISYLLYSPKVIE